MISLHLTSLFRTRTTSLTDRLFGRPPPKRASFAGEERHDLIPESDVPPRKVQILSSKAVSTERMSVTGADQCCAESETKVRRATKIEEGPQGQAKTIGCSHPYMIYNRLSLVNWRIQDAIPHPALFWQLPYRSICLKLQHFRPFGLLSRPGGPI